MADEGDNQKGGVCQIVGNTSFVSRARLSHPARTDKQLTPLMIAARKGDLAALKVALLGSADVNEQDAHGLTALFHGVYSRNVKVVCSLLQAGCSVRVQASCGITILMYAVLHGDAACLAVLCEASHPPHASPSPTRSLVNVQDTEGVTALMLACKTGSAACARILLEHGADANLYSFAGESALSYALMHNAVACVQELASRARFLDARSKRHPNGALYSAAQLGEGEIVHVLCCQRAYLQQFVAEVAASPARPVEVAVEVALREDIPRLSEARRGELGAVCIQQAFHCLRVLLEVAQGRPVKQAVSLSGLAECAKWCIKVGKVLTRKQALPQLNPLWERIEMMTDRQRQAFEKGCHKEASLSDRLEGQLSGQLSGQLNDRLEHQLESRTEAESRDESWNETAHSGSDGPDGPDEASSRSTSRSASPTTSPSPRSSSAGAFAEEKVDAIKPTTATRLLLSFIEIYALNYYSLPSADDKADAINRLQSMETLHPRLIAFFSKNKHFLWWARAAGVTCSSLVSSDPRVYNLLHFFKHSFNLYLQND